VADPARLPWLAVECIAHSGSSEHVRCPLMRCLVGGMQACNLPLACAGCVFLAAGMRFPFVRAWHGCWQLWRTAWVDQTRAECAQVHKESDAARSSLPCVLEAPLPLPCAAVAPAAPRPAAWPLPWGPS